MTELANVVIVGGGISGLTLAYRLERAGVRQVVLLEAQDRLGGNIGTLRRDDYLLDLGPDAWVAQKPETRALAAELGLGDQVITPLADASRVHLVQRGRLVPLPRGLVLGVPTDWPAFLRSPLFSPRAKARVLLEPLVPRVVGPNPEHDPSVGAFVEARLGREMTDKLLGPLLGGIFAGSAWDLSLRTAFPQLVRAEAEHGSLVRAFRARRRQQGGTLESPFLSLAAGMGSLIEALRAALVETRVSLSRPVRSVAPLDGGYRVVHATGSIQAKHVVFAGPAHVARATLELPALLPVLEPLQFGSAATVFAAFRDEHLQWPGGSGFLVPASERAAGLRILAGTFVSSKWPGRAPRGHRLLRVFFGGPDEAAVDEPDAILQDRALADLRRLLRVRAAPEFMHVFRLRGGSPRPSPGHLDRVRAVRAAVARFAGLHLLGNGYDGSGISDCIRQANEAARTIAASL